MDCCECFKGLFAPNSAATTTTGSAGSQQYHRIINEEVKPIAEIKSSQPFAIVNNNQNGNGMNSYQANTTNTDTVVHFPPRYEHSNLDEQKQSNASFNSKYELREELGVGSTSKCYKCIRKADGKEFACKVIDKRHVEMKFAGLLDQFFIEINVLKTVRHSNIISLEDTYETPDRIYMVMEIMKGGELFDYVVEKGTLSEEEASVLVRRITSAIAHMHSLNIIHRDLKPENLLLTNKGVRAEVKLIDFGLAKVIMQDSVASSFLGTKGYLAPEMLQRHSYDKAIDMWALGVIVFVLLCGCLPFDDDSSRITSESAKKKFTLRFPKWAASLSPSAKDLLQKLLEVNPKLRLTADQALAHPWVTGRTVNPNSYLQSPSFLGQKKKEMMSPLPPNYINHTHARISQGSSATTAQYTYQNYGKNAGAGYGAGGQSAYGIEASGSNQRSRKYSI